MTETALENLTQRLKQAIPALIDNAPVFLDAPSGTQMPRTVLDAMNQYVTVGTANRGGIFPTSLETESLLLDTRRKVCALLGASDHQVVFGQNMTSLAFNAASSLRRDWADPSKSVVVSELDHHANIDPWISCADDAGMAARWLPVDPHRYCLDLSGLDALVDDDCALVAVGLSSNAVGTASDIGPIIDRARSVGAVSVVDAVHGLSHIPVDVDELGADITFFSAYKIFGPHIGAMVIRNDALDRIRFHKLAPAPRTGYGKAELGTQNMEAVAGLSATIDFVASFGDDVSADLRHQITSAIGNFARCEEELTDHFVAGLQTIDGVTLARAPHGIPKTSTVAFTVTAASPESVAFACAKEGVYITHGDFYARTLAERTDVAHAGGWLRAGIAPYHDRDDIDRALNVLDRAIRLARRQP
ncbi:aminotransferase class V-fold PLP-dependent enzyme [Mycolicibacterium sp. YH-1]|uniref:aminotransferase class V-fold PLP-dependent enzyme n=1 Tax=Mycolicibacterium sp. YH-1 TaxID=2908837 RepID=UPI001F4BD469|nr:aminotransferase class V-fold PLP-dependent enzyme [Mycolicibacterium sp. YH-1]UNB52942.1 aminotransferase class V-fold PLP-dependent enzyme [Mycolicibacterium sp. YH-1]